MPAWLGISTFTTEHHVPYWVVSVPHRTSDWAMNGFTRATISGTRPLIGPRPRPLSLFAIPVQNASTKTDPTVMASTPKMETAVAAWVRRTRLEQSRPNDPSPRAVTRRTR